jgi:TetR/AcrR family transcriptional regulator
MQAKTTGARTGEDRRGTARRQAIVQAAVSVFADNGFEASSTREIARRAGIEQGLLTYHFPSKQALWYEAADAIFNDLTQHIEVTLETLTKLSRKKRNREGIREVVRYLAVRPEIFRFLVDAGNRSDEMMHWLVDRHLEPRFKFMIGEGVVKTENIDPTVAGHAFFALCGAASLIFAVAPACNRLTGIDATAQTAIDNHADFLANLMVP